MTDRLTEIRLLCVAAGCFVRGYHTPDCDDECDGCRPRRALDGLRLCGYHTDGIASDARKAAELHAQLATVLAGATTAGDRTSGTPDRGLNLNERASEARTLIRHRLVSWTLLIAEERGFSLPSTTYVETLPERFIGPPRRLVRTDDTEHALAEFIATSHMWLAAQDFAADAQAEMREMVQLAHPIAYPTGAKVFDVGPCPECAGTIKAIVRRVDSLLPSSLVCDLNDQHAWPADQWHALGRRLRRAA